MSLRSVSGSERGRRIVIERPPVFVDDVTGYDVDADGAYYLFGPGAAPRGDFRAGTVQAVYFADEREPGPEPGPLAQAG